MPDWLVAEAEAEAEAEPVVVVERELLESAVTKPAKARPRKCKHFILLSCCNVDCLLKCRERSKGAR